MDYNGKSANQPQPERTANADKMKNVSDLIGIMLTDPSRPWHRPVCWVRDRTGMQPFDVFLAAVVALSVPLTFGVGATTISNLIGFLYPAYATTELIVAPRPALSVMTFRAATKAKVKWIIYWLIFTLVLIAETLLGFLVHLLPCYYLLRTIFLIWCLTPIKNSGSAVVFAYVKHYAKALRSRPALDEGKTTTRHLSKISRSKGPRASIVH